MLATASQIPRVSRAINTVGTFKPNCRMVSFAALRSKFVSESSLITVAYNNSVISRLELIAVRDTNVFRYIILQRLVCSS